MDFTKIPVFLLFIVTLICGIANSNYKAYYIKKTMKNESELYSFNAGAGLVCTVVLFFLSGCSLETSLYSVLLGIIFGFTTMMSAIFSAKAIKIGPFGYTTVIISLATALTALSGAFFWNETLSIFKIIGIILMIGSFFFAIDTENHDEKKLNKKWFLLCILGLLTCALIGILQKIHQTSVYKNELMSFLFVAFLTNAIGSFGWYILQKRKEEVVEENKTPNKVLRFLIAVLICGIGAAGNNVLNLYLSGVTDTAIFFPVVNGVPLLTSLVVSFVLFKEKLKSKQLVGLFIGVVAIICLFI